jgi:hypothetical protein
MDNEKRMAILPDEKYLVTFGIRKPTFEAMLRMLKNAYKEMRKRGGRVRKLSVLDMLIIMLGYCHDYRTMENLGFEYGVHKQSVQNAIKRPRIPVKKTTHDKRPACYKRRDWRNYCGV